jgi:hypothetical protein
VPGTPDKGIILSHIPRTPLKHRKPSRLTIAVTGSTVAVAAVASATVSIWPASAAEQQPAAAPQNSELQQAAGPAASSAAANLAATGTVTVADTAGGAGIGRKATRKATKHLIAAQQIGGKVLIFKLRFIVEQNRRLALEVQRAAAARRARRQAARRAAAARAAAQHAAAAQRTAHRRAARASSQPSGSPQQIAMAMLGTYGWSSSEFGCLSDLWTRESGWNPAAANPSGAFGIPQALPGSKMASAGADWQTNPATQIRWGLGYIRDLYGSPCGAWNHELATGSY